MSVEFHLVVFDPELAQRQGEPAQVGFSLRGMTVAQAEAALPYLRSFTKKLEEFVVLQKHGSGEILAEPDDDQKTAAANFTEADREALVEENAEDATPVE